MLGFLVELCVSVTICSVLAYFLFLSAPAEDELCPDGSQTYPDEPHGPAAWLRSIKLWVEEDAFILSIYRATLNSVFGEESSEHEAGDGAWRQRNRRRRGDERQKGALPGSCRTNEGSQWLSVLSRWLGVVFLGGGTQSGEVWTDRLQYALERALHAAGTACEAKLYARAPPSAETLRGGKKPLVRLMGLQLGPGYIRDPPPKGADAHAVAGGDGPLNTSVKLPDTDGEQLLGGGAIHAAQPAVGVALPRVAGDIISVEIPSFSSASQRSASARSGDGEQPLGPVTMPQGATASQSQQSHSLRCFNVPVYYEDGRFHLRLACSLPLAALLPEALSIPPDVLSIDCNVALRRVMFFGNLYAAFHGHRVELSFPYPPQFHALFDVTTPRRAAPGRAAPVISMNLPSQFRAISTMRNESTTGNRASTPTAMRRHASAPSVSAPGMGCLSGHNEKVQELVLLAIQRAVESITYPRVLEGVLTPSTSGLGVSVAWNRQKASLPLYA